MEICLVPKRRVAAQYPGVYIFTSPGRLIRPVTNLKHDKIELIGALEQSYLQIAVTQKDIEKDKVIMLKNIALICFISITYIFSSYLLCFSEFRYVILV